MLACCSTVLITSKAAGEQDVLVSWYIPTYSSHTSQNSSRCYQKLVSFYFPWWQWLKNQCTFLRKCQRWKCHFSLPLPTKCGSSKLIWNSHSKSILYFCRGLVSFSRLTFLADFTEGNVIKKNFTSHTRLNYLSRFDSYCWRNIHEMKITHWKELLFNLFLNTKCSPSKSPLQSPAIIYIYLTQMILCIWERFTIYSSKWTSQIILPPHNL